MRYLDMKTYYKSRVSKAENAKTISPLITSLFCGTFISSRNPDNEPDNLHLLFQIFLFISRKAFLWLTLCNTFPINVSFSVQQETSGNCLLFDVFDVFRGDLKNTMRRSGINLVWRYKQSKGDCDQSPYSPSSFPLMLFLK